MQAMVMLCETQKEHPDYPKWVNSIQLYGEYLKGMMKYTHPYGMIPSGVYHAEEYKDTTNFYALHLFPPANAKELYTEQIKRGVQLDKEHYMKRFPCGSTFSTAIPPSIFPTESPPPSAETS